MEESMGNSKITLTCHKCGTIIDVEEAVAHGIRHKLEEEISAGYRKPSGIP